MGGLAPRHPLYRTGPVSYPVPSATGDFSEG